MKIPRLSISINSQHHSTLQGFHSIQPAMSWQERLQLHFHGLQENHTIKCKLIKIWDLPGSVQLCQLFWQLKSGLCKRTISACYTGINKHCCQEKPFPWLFCEGGEGNEMPCSRRSQKNQAWELIIPSTRQVQSIGTRSNRRWNSHPRATCWSLCWVLASQTFFCQGFQ